MTIAIGIVAILAGLICWIGQILSFCVPLKAAKMGVCELEDEMDHSLYIIETKAHGLTDTLLTWTLPLSALLMTLDALHWPILALIGGGIYLYFPGIIILHRVFLKRHGKKVGRPSSERGAYIFGVIWILSAVSMIVLATGELYGSYPC